MERHSRSIEFVVGAEDSGRILQNYLEGAKGISAKAVKKLKYQGAVLLNGQRTLMNVPVQAGDRLQLIYPPQPASPYIAAEPIPFRIKYEDTEVLVVAKEPYLCVHPTKGYPGGTLANGILYHWQSRGEKASFHLVNRLDKDTSGLVLIAKSAFAAQQLFNQQRAGKIRRAYLALVMGCLAEDQGRIDLPIARAEGRTTKRLVAPEGQRAVTNYQVLRRYPGQEKEEGYTYLEVSLETGRTHQIRVHFSHLGHPLAGDTFYGGTAGAALGRQFLHAYYLAFTHPVTKERLEFNQELPEDLALYLKNLEADR